jgi:hypothetical protein
VTLFAMLQISWDAKEIWTSNSNALQRADVRSANSPPMICIQLVHRAACSRYGTDNGRHYGSLR